MGHGGKGGGKVSGIFIGITVLFFNSIDFQWNVSVFDKNHWNANEKTLVYNFVVLLLKCQFPFSWEFLNLFFYQVRSIKDNHVCLSVCLFLI